MNVLALWLQEKLLVLGGDKAACKWEERSVPECYGGQQLCCCDVYEPSRVSFNAFLQLICFLSQFLGGQRTCVFFGALQSLIKVLGAELFLCRRADRILGGVNWAVHDFEQQQPPQGSHCCSRCFGGSGLQPAFLPGNSPCPSCWWVTWALQPTYPKGAGCKFLTAVLVSV